MEAFRVVDAIVGALAEAGISHVFGVGGANIEDLYDAIARAEGPVRAVVAKHEFSAGTMADGYFRASGRRAAVAVTSGGGMLNLVPALGEAYASQIPMLAIVGQIPTNLAGHGGFQDSSGQADTLNALALFRTVSRYCALVTAPDSLREHLPAALAASRSGPAVLLIPKDVQQADWTGELPGRASLPTNGPADDGVIAELTEFVSTHSPLVLIAGDELARTDARAAFGELVRRTGAAVVVTPDAKDVFDNNHPSFLGVAGVMGDAGLGKQLASFAGCVVVGSDLPVMARSGIESALSTLPVLSVGSRAPHAPGTHLTTTDLGVVLTNTCARLSGDPGPAAATKLRVEVPDVALAAGLLPYREAMETISAAIAPGSTVFVDAGNCGAAAVNWIDAPRDGRFVIALGMGGMGYTFGAGVGGAFASPDTRTWVIAGDGAFFMHGMEIHTAVEHQLPVTFVLVNNNSHAMCVTRDQLYLEDFRYNRFTPAHLARGLGEMFPTLTCRTATSPDELRTALDDLPAAGPAVIEVMCSADELPPFTPFLARTRELTATVTSRPQPPGLPRG